MFLPGNPPLAVTTLNIAARRVLAWTVVLVAMLLVVSGCARPEQELRVSDGWVRLSPPNSMMTAGYGTLSNTGEKMLVLKSFSSPQFGDVTLHYTEEVNGTATMREARSHSLAPGESLELSPGGYHLMLMQRKKPTPEGSDVEVTFEFDSGTNSAHLFTVTRR